MNISLTENNVNETASPDTTGESNNQASDKGFDPASHIEGFDASVHAVDANGAPIPSASGVGFRKKRGRKAGTVTKATLEKQTPKTPLEKQAQKVSAEGIAKSMINLGIGGAVAFIGDEWDFQSQQEADDMVAAVAGYINVKGGGNLSPEAMLLLVVGAYSLSRFKHKNTQSKFGAFFSGAFGMIKKLFTK